MRIQVVEDDFGVLAPLQLDDDAHAVLVGLVAQTVVGDALDLFVADKIGDTLDQARLVHLVGKFGDDDRLTITATSHLFEMGARTDR